MNSLLVAPLAVVAALLAAAPAAADSFQGDLAVVDGHLRVAIETAPEELGESLRSAELVCRLGERAAARPAPELAAADWATLGQLVDEAASGASHRVEVALGNADTALRDLRGRFERRWAGSADHLRELRRGAAATLGGIAVIRTAVGDLQDPFGRWRAHECEAAGLGVTTALGPVGAALEQINSGMLRLWRLAELPPPRPAGG